jgi:SET domain-containing protein
VFLVPTHVGRSPIHGLGAFASMPIAAGTLIWRFDPTVDWRLSASDLERFPEPYQSWFRAYCYLADDGLYVYCGDNAKYMNHDPNPNCDDSGMLGTVTLRDIQAGEELTCDYRAFDAESAGDAALRYDPPTVDSPMGDGGVSALPSPATKVNTTSG